MKLGSTEHRERFCRSIMDSHRPYEPEELAWPELDEVHLSRLRGIPFWDEALKTELEAGIVVGGFARQQGDALLRDAIALQGYEEDRHARLIRHMIRRYEIELEEPEPGHIDPDLEKAFVYFGYGECLDSFGAFGLFELARQAEFMPLSFFEIFDHVLQEEARHIVFFTNWMAYRQIERGLGAPPLRGAKSLWCYTKVLFHLLDLIRGADDQQESFTATGGVNFVEDLTARRFIDTCLRENARRMSGFEPQLLQPRLLPRLAGLAHSVLNLLPSGGAAAKAAH